METRLSDAFARGHWLVGTLQSAANHSSSSLPLLDAHHNTIDATIIRRVLLGESAMSPVGVRLRNFRVAGQLDLDDTNIQSPLIFESCSFDSDFSIARATALLIVLKNCKLPELNAERLALRHDLLLDGTAIGKVGLRSIQMKGNLSLAGVASVAAVDLRSSAVEGDVRFDKETHLSGGLVLRDSCIGGQLILAGTFGSTEDRVALEATEVTVGRSVSASGLKTCGSAIFDGAHIAGTLNFANSRLEAKGGVSFSGNGLKVDGDVKFIRSTMNGMLRVMDASIGGILHMAGATLQRTEGASFNGQGMTVGGNVFMRDNFTSASKIVLRGAEIKGVLNVGGACIGSEEWGSIDGEGMVLGGSLQISEWRGKGCVLQGELVLRSSRIGRVVNIAKTDLSAVSLVDLSFIDINGSLRFSPVKMGSGTRLNLRQASVGEFLDSESSWPSSGNLDIDGFRYRRLAPEAPIAVEVRLEWLRRQQSFSTDPYEALSSYYRATGREESVKIVAIAMRRELRRSGELTGVQKVTNLLLDVGLRYGYRPGRALIALLVLILGLGILSGLASQVNGFIPTRSTSTLTISAQCDSSYPCFNPWAYSIDTTVPLVNLRQADYWQPDSRTQWGMVMAYVSWIVTLIGWLLSTLGAGAAALLIRRL